MLKQRLMTALVLIPIVIWLIYGVPTGVLACVFGAILMLGAMEWAKMVPCSTRPSRFAFMSVTALLLVLGYWLSQSATAVLVLGVVAVVWWCFVVAWLARVRLTGHSETADGWVVRVAVILSRSRLDKAVIGLLLLVPCFVSVMFLHASADFGASYVFFCLSLMWAADSGAYFAGKKWGNRKLAPGVSPGKTIEGVSGGFAMAALWTLLWMFFAGLGETSPALFFLIAMVVTVFSVAGDLFESLFKRIANIKDSGHILPGHGGVLDRIDSLMAGAPVFVFGLMFL